MSSPNFSTLPEELVLEIFQYLPENTLARTAQACKRFQSISYDSMLWKRIVFKNKTLSPGTLGFILARGTKKLNIYNCQFKEPLFLEEAPEDGYQLQHLRVKDYKHKLSNELRLLLSRCRQLKSINLEVSSVNDGLCSEIAQNSHLEFLHLGTHGLTYTGLITIVRRCRRLRSLQHEGKEVPMTELQLQTLVEELPSSIRIIDIFRWNPSLLDNHIATLVKNCPNMTDVCLSGCTNITETTITHLSTLGQLYNLNISNCDTIPASALSRMPNLKSFKTLWWTIE